MALRRSWQTICAGVLALALAACETTPPVSTPTAPPPPAVPGAAEPSAVSRELAAFYARYERDQIARGLLRSDGGGPDVPFSQRQLVENFIRIGLFEEFSNVGGTMVARQTESRLHRWQVPVRLGIEFGPSVPAAQRDRDRTDITRYASRLARVTGHPITTVSTGANYHVLVLNEDERRGIGPRLLQIVPGLSNGAIRAIQNIPRSTFCLVFAIDPDDNGAYRQAVAIIRAEHPQALRLSCIHEELAQGLGLSNDSPAARPSIFNDDEEFGLLTTHDEYLLRMLYDRRMRIGMTAAEARPVAEVIAAELMGGPV